MTAIAEQRTKVSSTFEQLQNELDLYNEMMMRLKGSDELLPQTISKMKEATDRMEAIISCIERRGNVIMNIALEEAGIARFIEKWQLGIDRKPQRLIDDADQEGHIRFFLSHDRRNRWKGNFLTCPLLRIMRMKFPIEWLDMSTKQLRSIMRQKLLDNKA